MPSVIKLTNNSKDLRTVKFTTLFISNLFCAALAISGTAQAAQDKVLRVQIGNSGEAPYLEHTSAEVLAAFNAAVLGQLIKTDENFNLFPGLLQKFEYDFKAKAYVLKLQPNLKFHNGRKVTSKDLEFSLLRGFFTKSNTFHTIYLNNIAGLDKIDAGRTKYTSGLVSGVKIIDELSVRVKLSHPNPSFLHSLTNPFFSLVPKEEMNSNFVGWKKIPVGAGPYRVLGKGFHEGKVNLELMDKGLEHATPKIEFYTSEAKGIHFDLVSSPSENQKKQLKVKYTSKPIAVRALFFNNKNELSRNQDFRNAIQYAIDRNEIASSLEGYDVVSEILPRHFWGRSGNGMNENIDLAKKYVSRIPKKLTEKFWEAGIFAGPKLSHKHKTIVRYLERQFARAGLKIKFVPTSEKFQSLESAKKFVFRVEGRIADYVDPLIMFASFREGSAFKYGYPIGDRKVRFDKLYSKAEDAEDFNRRIESVRELSKFVQKESIAIALGEERFAVGIDPKRIQSMGHQPQPLTLFIQNIELK